MGKGEQTKAAILDEASDLASRLGLGGLTIGTLATASKLSKSGLYAHFASKESLQVEVLQYARDQFTDHVMRPTVKAARASRASGPSSRTGSPGRPAVLRAVHLRRRRE